MRPSRRDRTSRWSCTTWPRARSCSRSSMPRSSGVVSTPRTSGAAPGCRHTAGPTPTAPASPTVRRPRRRRCWRAPRSIRGRRSAPGSPCSYTPANPNGNVTIGDEGLPRPWNPLPCAGAAVGPFGGPGFPAPIDVQISPPDPNGLPPTPGIPAAAPPGGPPPNVPGTPVPLPDAPPGARTDAGATGTILAAAGASRRVRPLRLGLGRSCRPRSSIQADPGVAA